jgi:hypothetical protein
VLAHPQQQAPRRLLQLPPLLLVGVGVARSQQQEPLLLPAHPLLLLPLALLLGQPPLQLLAQAVPQDSPALPAAAAPLLRPAAQPHWPLLLLLPGVRLHLRCHLLPLPLLRPLLLARRALAPA